ncbi:YSIRK-type signal peptide-containing protein [Streptococcus sp. 20-1249]|uniref:YSIRK-type signal peptide-containing protein n=1 Tax=Streptococcus hepaticus TaxID=3349163 RepID=UPI003748DC72
MKKNIFSLRKKKTGLVSLAIAAAFLGTVASAEEQVQPGQQSPSAVLPVKEDESPDMKESSLESLEQPTGEPVAVEKADDKEVEQPVEQPSEESEPIKEEQALYLEVNPVKAGDQVISGKATPGSLVMLEVDNPIGVEEDGQFSLPLSEPATYGQTFTVLMTILSESEDDEEEGEPMEKTVEVPRHPQAYELPKETLTKSENGHQVLVEPIIEGTGVIKGHTSVQGSVFLTVNDMYYAPETKIREDGSFEIQLSPDLMKYDVRFKLGMNINLQFVSNDGESVLVRPLVYKMADELESSQKGHQVNPILSSGQESHGRADSYGKVFVYDAVSKTVLAKVDADENGYYSLKLDKLTTGQKLYRFVFDAFSKLQEIVEDTVDQSSQVLPDDQLIERHASMNIYSKDNTNTISQAEPLTFQLLHTRRTQFVGRTYFPNTYIQLISDSGNKFPTLMADKLGNWGTDFEDLKRTLHSGENITIQVIDPLTKEVLTSKTVTVIDLYEIDPVTHRPKWVAPDEIPAVLSHPLTTDYGYLKGHTVPNAVMEVYLRGELVAQGESDGLGRFNLDLGETILKEKDMLTIYAFHKISKAQVVYDKLYATKGIGSRLAYQADVVEDLAFVDTVSKIKVVGDSQVMPTVASISVEAISAPVLALFDADSYDIVPLDKNGNPAELFGEVTVIISVRAKVAHVYHVKGNQLENLDFQDNGDGTISFKTNHFSQYAVVYQSKAANEAQAPSTPEVNRSSLTFELLKTEGTSLAAKTEKGVAQQHARVAEQMLTAPAKQSLPKAGEKSSSAIWSILGLLGLAASLFYWFKKIKKSSC